MNTRKISEIIALFVLVNVLIKKYNSQKIELANNNESNIDNLTAQMIALADEEKYEEAAIIRDQIKSIK